MTYMIEELKEKITKRFNDNLDAEAKCPVGLFGAAAKEDLEILPTPLP